ncbi:hypothetical protein VP01_353g4, partial [Puccinia sorghi]
AQLKKTQDDIEELEKDSPKVDNDNIFELFNAPPNSAERKELEVYIKNMDQSSGQAAKDQKSLLICLNPRTIERCVSSHMWLKQGIQVTGKFEKAQNIFKNYVDFSQQTSKKLFCFYILSIILCILNHNTVLHYHYLVSWSYANM